MAYLYSEVVRSYLVCWPIGSKGHTNILQQVGLNLQVYIMQNTD